MLSNGLTVFGAKIQKTILFCKFQKRNVILFAKLKHIAQYRCGPQMRNAILFSRAPKRDAQYYVARKIMRYNFDLSGFKNRTPRVWTSA